MFELVVAARARAGTWYLERVGWLIGERAAGEPQWFRARREVFCGSRRRGALKLGEIEENEGR